ncbi:MAG: flagellar export protein FliJ [Halioglobus sp.]|nr:flagellar export protein FliJ [Halioglobus sp.]MCB1708249.1 flagellar export protein FliJ [Halioglobus sp.]MCP5120964.1 flagellar export protein FliJ [Pseudomonadales bacterium]MCP5194406.1 flagellar export protein FliJ [Pseudomonadales bacterium]
MKRKKMDKVAAVAKIAEQQSARELNVVRQSHDEKSDRLEQLVQFKEDYETSLETAAEKGMPAKQLQDYRLFMSKLNQAIDKQSREVETTGQSLEEVREEWISKSHRKSALEHLLQAQRREQLLARERAEQKESDENTLARKSANREQ